MDEEHDEHVIITKKKDEKITRCPRCNGTNIEYQFTDENETTREWQHHVHCVDCAKFFIVKEYSSNITNPFDGLGDMMGLINGERFATTQESEEIADGVQLVGGVMKSGDMLDMLYLGRELSPPDLRKDPSWKVFCDAIYAAGLTNPFYLFFSSENPKKFDMSTIVSMIKDQRNVNDFIEIVSKIDPEDLKKMLDIAIFSAIESKIVDRMLHEELKVASEKRRKEIWNYVITKDD